MVVNTRRQFLKIGSTVGILRLAGCTGDGDRGSTPEPTVTTSTPPGSPTTTRSETGTERSGRLDEVEYHFVNNAGTRVTAGEGGPFFRHGYRSGEPLLMETDVGGQVHSRDHERGIESEINLTEEDEFGEAGVMTVVRDLNTISEIAIQLEGNVFVTLQLGVEYNDDSIYEWVSTGEGKERTKNLDGDRALLTSLLSGPSITIERDDRVFSNPESETAKSIADLLDDAGSVPTRIVATINGGSSPFSGDMRSATVFFENITVAVE